MSDKTSPKKPPEEIDPEKPTTFIHNMFEGDSILLNGNIEIHLQEGRVNRATLRIRAPKSVPIKRNR